MDYEPQRFPGVGQEQPFASADASLDIRAGNESRRSTRAAGGTKPTLVCHNFSDIRRRPLVIGRLDQVQLPFVVTMPQLACGVLVFLVLLATRMVWGQVLSDRLHIVVFVGVPIIVAQQVTQTSIEGRSVLKAAIGYFRLLTAPRHGTVNGRRQSRPKPTNITVKPLVEVAVEPRRPKIRLRGSFRRGPRSRRSKRTTR